MNNVKSKDFFSRAERSLRESEAQKKAILDASIDRIRLVDTDMKIIWANKTTTREVNTTPEDLVGKFCYRVFVGRDSPCPECPTQKALKSSNIEHAILHQPYSKGIEGETYWDTYTVPIKNESGDIVNLIQVARNITEQKKVEEALRESEEKYRTLFESANDAIFIADKKTNIILDANIQAEQLIGRPREEIIGMHQSELHPPDYAEYYMDKFHGYLQKGRVFDLEAEVIARDGSIVPVFISASIISLNGKEVIQWLFRDITKERRILDLKEEIAARKLIEKAKGVLMDRNKISEKEAMRLLQKESRRQRKKIKEIAQGIISSELILN